MPILGIPSSILSLVPPPRTQNAVAAAQEALAAGMLAPTKPLAPAPNTTIKIPQDLYDALNKGRGYASRFFSAAIVDKYGDPIVRRKVDPHPPRLLLEPTGKAQVRIDDARKNRVKTALEDIEDGKWGRVFITGGHRSVDPWREDGDYHDEIQSGLVIRSVVPIHLGIDAVMQFMSQHSVASRMHWWYLDGDSETLTVARDAQVRAELLLQGGEAAENVRILESEEALQIRLFGHRTAFIAMAAADAKALGYQAHPKIEAIAKKLPIHP